MRKLIAVLTILVGTLGVIGAAPATSSAGYCTAMSAGTFDTNYIYWDGAMAFTAEAAGCSGIAKVQFALGSPAGQTGIVNWAAGSTPSNYWGAIMHGAYNGQGTFSLNGGPAVRSTIHVGRWCITQLTQLAAPYLTFRLYQSATPNTPGDWHYIAGHFQYIWC